MSSDWVQVAQYHLTSAEFHSYVHIGLDSPESLHYIFCCLLHKISLEDWLIGTMCSWWVPVTILFSISEYILEYDVAAAQLTTSLLPGRKGLPSLGLVVLPHCVRKPTFCPLVWLSFVKLPYHLPSSGPHAPIAHLSLTECHCRRKAPPSASTGASLGIVVSPPDKTLIWF